jgi:hypothetical protein
LPEACGGAAELVNPDDLPAVTEAMRHLVTDPQELLAAKRRACCRAANASWHHAAQRFEAAILKQESPAYPSKPA